MSLRLQEVTRRSMGTEQCCRLAPERVLDRAMLPGFHRATRLDYPLRLVTHLLDTPGSADTGRAGGSPSTGHCGYSVARMGFGFQA